MELNEIPRDFVELFDAGRFDYWGAPYESLTNEQRMERMGTHESQVLWWDTIEWTSTPDDIVAWDPNGDDGYLRPGLVPFAGNGYGDLYCWYPPWQEGAAEPPIVLFLHDERESARFARTFSECLTRCFLQEHANWDLDDPGPLDPARRALWDAHLAILRPVLDDADIEILSSLGADAPRLAYEAADEAIAARVGDRTLVGMQPSTHYNAEAIDDRTVTLRLYDQSITFYRELIEGEGRTEFRSKLDEVVANRAAFAGEA